MGGNKNPRVQPGSVRRENVHDGGDPKVDPLTVKCNHTSRPRIGCGTLNYPVRKNPVIADGQPLSVSGIGSTGFLADAAEESDPEPASVVPLQELGKNVRRFVPRCSLPNRSRAGGRRYFDCFGDKNRMFKDRHDRSQLPVGGQRKYFRIILSFLVRQDPRMGVIACENKANRAGRFSSVRSPGATNRLRPVVASS